MFTTAHNSFYAKLKRAEMWKNIMNLKSISLGKKILNNQRLFAVWKHLSIIVLINLIKISAANKSFSLINYSNSSLLVDAWGILLSWLHKADEILNLFNVWNMCQTYMHYQHQYEHPVKPTQRDEPSLVPYSLWKKKNCSKVIDRQWCFPTHFQTTWCFSQTQADGTFKITTNVFGREK